MVGVWTGEATKLGTLTMVLAVECAAMSATCKDTVMQSWLGDGPLR